VGGVPTKFVDGVKVMAPVVVLTTYVPDAVVKVVAVQFGGVSPLAHSFTLDGTRDAEPTDVYPASNKPVKVPGVSFVRGVKTIG
jgi:hypothetical protein